MLSLLATLTIWHWLGLSVMLFILELVLASGGFLLWIGLSSLMTAVLVWLFPSLDWAYQLLIFAIGGIMTSICWWLYLQRNPLQTDKPVLNKRSQQYIGRVFTLEEGIVNGRGAVRVDDTVWRVSGKDMPSGAKVKVIGVNGVILQVEVID